MDLGVLRERAAGIAQRVLGANLECVNLTYLLDFVCGVVDTCLRVQVQRGDEGTLLHCNVAVPLTKVGSRTWSRPGEADGSFGDAFAPLLGVVLGTDIPDCTQDWEVSSTE